VGQHLKLMKENFKFHKIKMTIEIFEKWINVLTKPKEVFAEEKAYASLGKAIKIIFVAGVIAGIFGIIANYILLSLMGTLLSLPSSYTHSFPYGDFFGTPLSLPEYLALSFVAGVIYAPIIFLIFSGINYLFAKLFKGEGNFTTQTYLIALFYAPCIVITSALGIIPFFGGLLALFVLIYELYLLTLALKETHQYSTGKAILTWLIPLIILMVIMFVIAIMWFISMVPFMNPNI